MNSLVIKNVELRAIDRSEIELIRSWRNSLEVASYMYNEEPIDKDQQVAWFEKISHDELSKYWMICFEGKPMGLANLAAINYRHKRCDWAFYLGSPEARGKGIGSKVEFLILDYVFTELNFNKLCCEVFTFNEAVIEQHKKFGFTIEGARKNHILKNDKQFDIVEMAIIKEEWIKVRPSLTSKILG